MTSTLDYTITYFSSLLYRGCYLGIYAGLGSVQGLFVLSSAISLAAAIVFASRTLHNKLLKNVFRCPMSFFDTTPLGRVLNRFSLDIFIIDEVIPTAIHVVLYRLFTFMGILLVIIITSPALVIVIIPLCVFYLLVQVRDRLSIYSYVP